MAISFHPRPMHIPPDWAKDAITGQMQGALNVAMRNFALHREPWKRLLRLDEAIDMAPAGYQAINFNPSATALGMRVLPMFRSCCEVALQGRLFEASSLTRSLVECAAYAMQLSVSREALETWSTRQASDATRKASRKAFERSNLRVTQERIAPGSAHLYDLLYEDAVDFGAHPNIAGVHLGTTFQATPQGIRMDAPPWTEDQSKVLACLGRVEMGGVVALQMLYPAFSHINRDRRLDSLFEQCLEDFNNSPIFPIRDRTCPDESRVTFLPPVGFAP